MAKRWTADQILELSRSYQTACVLSAAADHELFDHLGDEACTADQLAAAASTDPRATAVLLDALVALELLEKEGSRYRAAPGVSAALTRTGDASVLAMAQHQANCLRRWVQLTEVVQRGEPAERRPSLRGPDADLAAFVEAMDNVSRPIADTVIAELPPLSFGHLLDIGGATGTWTIAWLRRYPRARATLFDLPPVIPQARDRLTAAGLADRVTLAPGDFYTDALPTGADLAWISAILHQNSRAQNAQLLRAVHAALPPGGQLLIRDLVMDESRTQPAGGALFAVNMLVSTAGGGTYTMAETTADLQAAGFTNVRLIRTTGDMNSIIQATRAE